jgi:hypothetical protein
MIPNDLSIVYSRQGFLIKELTYVDSKGKETKEIIQTEGIDKFLLDLKKFVVRKKGDTNKIFPIIKDFDFYQSKVTQFTKNKGFANPEQMFISIYT